MFIVINGGGKIGEYLAFKMLEKGHEVAIIEQRREAARHLAEVLPNKAFIICGDGCDSSFQADADVPHSDVFVATTGADDENLVSCEIARTVYKVPRAIARVNNPKNLRIFAACGIEAVSSTTIISQIIEEEAFTGDVKMLSYLRKNDIIMSEVEIPPTNKFFPPTGKKVTDITLPEGSLIVAVASDDNLETVNADTRIFQGDTVIALTKRDDIGVLRQSLHVSAS